MEATGELGWFRTQIVHSLLHPVAFARSLATEHYGLAGVLVAVLAGAALSIAIDALVLASKHGAPLDVLPALFIGAVFLGLRLAVTVAVLAALAHYALRLLRRAPTLDQAFTAQSFALTPLLLTPVVMLPAAFIPELLVAALVIASLLLLRALLGLALGFAAILPLPLATLTLVVVLGAGAVALQDEIARVRFSAYSTVPQLVPELRATRASGTVFETTDFTLTIPSGWTNQATGARGEAARFVSDTGDLRVLRTSNAPLDVAETYADTVAAIEKRGLESVFSSRTYVRVNGVVMIEDTYGGALEGHRILYQQFTGMPGRQGFALVFHYVDPPPSDSLRDTSGIAATLRIKVTR